jgi:hypothetical protein
MEKTETYENFPGWIVFMSNAVSGLISISGLLIISRLGWLAAGVWLLVILAFEYRLLSRHCTNCYYWGKTCGFGKGKLSSLLFRKGDTSAFCARPMTWKDLLPDLLLSLIPVVTGIVLLIIEFDFLILSALILIVLLTTSGNGYIRGNLTCRYCRQRELGCPAIELFNKGKQ